MANEQNLVSLATRTPRERKEISKKGAKASGEARRKRKAIKEQLEMFLSLPLKDENAKANLKRLGIDTDDIDNQMALVISMWKQALKGNVGAFNTIRDTVGEKPIEKVEVSQQIDETINEIDNYINKKKSE